MASNLYEYYTGQGQALPSLGERASIYEKSGLGSASEYGGTAEQNTALLGSLQNNPPAVNTTGDASALAQGTQALAVPPTQPPQDYNSIVQGLVSGQQTQLDQAQAEAKPLQEKQSSLTSSIETLLGQSQQKGAEQLALEEQANIQGQQRDIQALTNQLTEIGNRTTAQQIATVGKGGINSIVQGQQARIGRENAIEALTISAQLQAKQGNLALAQSQINRAIDLKYEPIQQEIENKLKLLDLNRDLLSSAEKKIADAQSTKLNLQLKQAEEAKNVEQTNNNTAQNYAKYALDSGQSELASQISALNPASPTFRQELASLQAKIKNPVLALDLAIKQQQLATEQRKASLLGQPTAAEIKAQNEALKNAQSSIPVMNDKIDAVDALLESSGLNSRVGTNIFSRKPTSTFESFLKGFSAGDTVDKVSGAGQAFAGGVHKLVSGLALDSLIEAKARGATFGALSDSELNILANSASAINDWEIKDDKGVGTGVWNIDEATFKAELQRIQDLTRRALILSQDQVLTADESSSLDSIYQEAVSLNPANYY